MKITVFDNKHKIIEVDPAKTILENIRESGYYLTADCGGKGVCGKCKIRAVKGELPVTDKEQQILTPQELEEGWRLACLAYPVEACLIDINYIDESKMKVTDSISIDIARISQNKVEDDKINSVKSMVSSRGLNKQERCRYFIAIDIGTTTVAMHLVECNTGKTAAVHTDVNRQRLYGSDVISRIEASNSGKNYELQYIIQQVLNRGIENLLESAGVGPEKIEQVIIAANTTMVHLLMGYSCEKLGVFPFEAFNLNRIETTYSELLNSAFIDCKVVIFPGISAFIGGDITAGLFCTDVGEKKEITLFVDLGTNGEMALGNQDRILAASTAAGPAFEAGNIECGVAGIPGAVSGLTINNGRAQVKTIDHKPPIGICGTGVIEIAAELLKNGMMDETGLLNQEYKDGYVLGEDINGRQIVFTQEDVRQYQLAKSAVRAGIETLILRYGIKYEDINTVYLAGGFGYKVNAEKAVITGLFPEELKDKIITPGNTSLGGAVRLGIQKNSNHSIEHIIKITKELSLAEDEKFQELYLQHMLFDF